MRFNANVETMRNASLILYVSMLLIVASCSMEKVSGHQTSKQSNNKIEIDFVRHLSRTDSEDVCVKRIKPQLIAELGAGFFPENYYTAICECARDSAQHQINESVVSNDALRNAILQVSTNYDVLDILREGEDRSNWKLLEEFLETDARQSLGFGHHEFRQALAKIKENRINTHTKVQNYPKTIPSCKRTATLAKLRIPDWDPETGEAGAEPFLALQRLDHDKAINRDFLVGIIRADNKNELCQQFQSFAVTEIKDENNEGIAKILDCTNTIEMSLETHSKLNTSEYLLYKKITLSQFYVDRLRTTAKADDVKYLFDLNIENLGWSKNAYDEFVRNHNPFEL